MSSERDNHWSKPSDLESGEKGRSRKRAKQKAKRSGALACLVYLLQVIYFIIQIVFMLTSVGILACGICGLVLLKFKPEFESAFSYFFIYGICATGMAALLHSIYAIYCVVQRKKIQTLVYIFVLLIFIGIEIGVILHSDEILVNLDTRLNLAWDRFTRDTRRSLQSSLKCCGFSNLTDRPVLPCPDDSRSGCLESLDENVELYRKNTVRVYLASFCVQASVLFLTLVLVYLTE